LTTVTAHETINLQQTLHKNRLIGLWRLMQGFRWHYLGAALSLGIAATARTATYLLLGYFVDSFLVAESTTISLPLMALSFVLLAIVTGGFSFLSGALPRASPDGCAIMSLIRSSG
jgi:ABC-type multidrug transport system fused ATPase/permease subunit